MKSTDSLCIGTKVKEGYEQNDYNSKYRTSKSITYFEKKCLDIFLEQVIENKKILDLGCGAAKTYDCYMIKKGCSIVGVDFSPIQIERAKQNCPQATFYCQDILDFPISEKYGGITFFYSLFHICREKHQQLFRRIYENTSQDCVILLNIRKEDGGLIKRKADFCNYPMYWSYFSCEMFLDIVTKIGYKYLIIGDEKDYGSEESHLWVILRK